MSDLAIWEIVLPLKADLLGLNLFLFPILQVTLEMIKTIRHKGLKRFFIDGNRKLLNPIQIKRIELLLNALDIARDVQEMDAKGNHLHELKGDKKGFWSIRVSGNWRLTFRFIDGDAYDINLEDYH